MGQEKSCIIYIYVFKRAPFVFIRSCIFNKVLIECSADFTWHFATISFSIAKSYYLIKCLAFLKYVICFNQILIAVGIWTTLATHWQGKTYLSVPKGNEPIPLTLPRQWLQLPRGYYYTYERNTNTARKKWIEDQFPDRQYGASRPRNAANLS